MGKGRGGAVGTKFRSTLGKYFIFRCKFRHLVSLATRAHNGLSICNSNDSMGLYCDIRNDIYVYRTLFLVRICFKMFSKWLFVSPVENSFHEVLLTF